VRYSNFGPITAQSMGVTPLRSKRSTATITKYAARSNRSKRSTSAEADQPLAELLDASFKPLKKQDAEL
jgi:hypothetical protein